MIVGQTKGSSSRFPTSVFAAGILIICGWISPTAGAGADVSKEGFPKATPTQVAQHSESGSSMSQTNYGGMVVVGIIAVLTAVVGSIDRLDRGVEVGGSGVVLVQELLAGK